MTLPVVFHPDYVTPLRLGHRFPMSKYGYLRQHLIDANLIEQGGYLSPAEASVGLLTLAHAPDYVDKVLGKTLGEKEVREIGLPLSDKLIRRVRLSSAGTLLAARLAMEHGVACNGAGGSHHAAHAVGSGYCVFNDVAVAAAALVSEGVISRVLVVDLDVHQGDGTAQIFA
ncbi:MAG: histone deacetylase, partial [Paracoccaceae bacterium]|nr:histone deacetylase [Paracoccaceae bacterium]